MKNLLALKTLIEKLEQSPLFYLFLSSRELFHTNFWFWLSTLKRVETIKLFSDATLSSQTDFFREYYQKYLHEKSKVDLLISDNGIPAIVIENKVKDFPTSEQLDRIKTTFSETSPEFTLVTLFWSPELKYNGWAVKTYRQLSEQLIPENFTKDSYYKSLIQDYKGFILNLAELAEHLPINHVYDFAKAYNKELFAQLNSIKLWEGFQKLRASHLLLHFAKANAHQVEASYRINNQKVTIQFLVPIRNGYNIGIQIEDNQYRKFIYGPKHDQFAENLRSNNIFFNSGWLSPQKKPICSYNPNFRYQYEKLLPLRFNQLFAKINADIDYIKNNWTKINYLLP
jgi:hypothetical protein